MATLTQAEKNIEAAEQAEREQRIRAEQTRLDNERAAEDRRIRNDHVRAAQNGRESEMRDAEAPCIPFEFNGYRATVLLGEADPALRTMAIHACTVIAHYLTTLFMNRLAHYRRTSQVMDAYDWPSHVVNLGEVTEAYRHGLIVVEQIPSAPASA